jgi:hypothetical protein
MARNGLRSRARSHPCGCAEQRSGRGGARASCASLTSSLHLCEVSERSERCELCNAPVTRAAQVARSAAGAAGRRHRGRPFFGYFLSAKRKKVTALPGAYPGPGTLSPRSVEDLPPRTLRFYCKRLRRLDVPRRGLAPAGDYLFLSRQEKEAKEGDPGPRDPSRLRRQGQPAVLAAGAHRTTRTTHCVRSPRTGAMSQSTKRAMLARRPCHCAPRRGDRGGSGFGTGVHSGHRFARPTSLVHSASFARISP